MTRAKWAYYNEHDRFAVAWLRELIAAGQIADGEVDERDIQTVAADDVRGFRQCHWFAGIGGWSRALRLAGWPDERPVWTGSCPCQPFSNAGTHSGGNDPRHLWPAWFLLIRECRPDVVFGEQVETAVQHGWLDLVVGDLEGEGYACGAAVLGAHSVGAPHHRQRLWFVADSVRNRKRWNTGTTSGTEAGSRCARGAGWLQNGDVSSTEGDAGELGHSDEQRSQGRDGVSERAGERAARSSGVAGIVSRESFWAACTWLPCRDGKSRPVEPGTFPLVARVSSGVVPSGDPSREDAQASSEARVMRLRGYGNAIVPQLAAEFIVAAEELFT